MSNTRSTTLKLLKNKVVQAQTTLDTRETVRTVSRGAPFTGCYSLSKLLRDKRVVGNLSVWRCKIRDHPKH